MNRHVQTLRPIARKTLRPQMSAIENVLVVNSGSSSLKFTLYKIAT